MPAEQDLYTNHGNYPTNAQKFKWCEKVGRKPSMANSITVVERVKTEAYPGSDIKEKNLREFARMAGEATGTGIKGGYVLTILYSIETYAGFRYKLKNKKTGKEWWPGDSVCVYNNNPFNVKYPRVCAQQDAVTPPVYFLVDQRKSLDFYESADDLVIGIKNAGKRSFMNARYNQYGTIKALENGDLNEFCEAIGKGGFADCYATDRKYMEGRARMLTKNYKLGSSLDPGIIIYT